MCVFVKNKIFVQEFYLEQDIIEDIEDTQDIISEELLWIDFNECDLDQYW